ncbi:MAG: FGGY family carbohydrate kinase [Ginsengibacter sp.]
MIALPVIAIFDIGKTNKKFFLIDEAYNIVMEKSKTFIEIKDEDGDPCEDISVLTNWVIKIFTKILQLENFDVKAVNFSAYGASLVYVDDKGKVIAPLYNYLKIYPEKLKDALYEKYGGEEKISCETASPVLGSLNSGLQLYRMMIEKPGIFKKIKYALHLPQYLSFVITRQMVSDITSLGSHTQLWDFKRNDYHTWVKESGLEKKLAPLIPSGQTTSITFYKKKLKAGVGLHDSSAALIPYLITFKEPFVLISTGTWCISLNPFNNLSLTKEELKKDCLCYMEYNGKAVKAARLFAGQHHEIQIKTLSKHFNKPAGFYKKIKYSSRLISSLQDLNILEKKFTEKNDNNFLHVSKKRELNIFKNYEEAYHCLMYDIMQQQFVSTQLILNGSSVNRIFVDGGFGNNSVYMHLLAIAFPHMQVCAASVAQATAIGAALAIHNSWNSFSVPGDLVKLTYY